ncbi:MAG: hypothetical protein A3H98_00985 [Bacteroidetes bacterium RIFCSPLOWO2_02_FULL_36_8]|nr:MAG: hypothetical protein A3H98_00985 [Bacteroidetes bacterium RIFCSPLOWO2_02_FULL_36_8]OFY71021.1 MAG: hypothetical protein A3G23_12980 [Bacteroidetes bacterium RIFCSPLOWO2_12_FULL_37_12]
MKKLLFTLLFPLSFFPLYAQTIPSAEELKKLGANPIQLQQIEEYKKNKNEIPSTEELRKMGASDADIKQIEQFRNKQAETDNPVLKPSDVQKTSVTTPPPSLPEKPLTPAVETPKPAPVATVEKTDPKTSDRIYGQGFFSENRIAFFQKSGDIKVTDNYVMGVGDKINVTVWGFSDYNDIFEIRSDGAIQIKETGKIFLKGLRFGEAQSLIKNRFESFMNLKDSKIEINLVFSRNITINLVGEVEVSGSYTLPAINTAFNALSAAGGLKSIATVRKIQVRRSGKTIKTLDLYDFLLNPDSKQEFYLEDNDYLFVPPYEKAVTIRGAVKRPGIYELLDKENLSAIIRLSGGTLADAYLSRLQVKRYQDNKEIIEDINYEKLLQQKKDYELHSGDEITIRKIPEGILNYVEIKGAVQLPGKYQFQKGQRILDIIKQAEGVNKDFYPENAYLLRLKKDQTREYIYFQPKKILSDPSSEDNFILQEEDIITLFFASDFNDYLKVNIQGAVRKPGEYLFSEKLTMKGLLLMAGGLQEDAYLGRGYVLRFNEEMRQVYIPFQLDTLNDYAAMDTFRMKMFDNVRIFPKQFFMSQDSVSIFGEVRKPGTYYFSQGMNLGDIIYLSGGLKEEASLLNIEISRLDFYQKEQRKKSSQAKTIKIQVSYPSLTAMDSTAKNFILFPYDRVFVRTDPDYIKPEIVYLEGEVLFPGAYSLVNKSERLSSVIQRAGGVTPYAFLRGTTFTRNINNVMTSVKIDLKSAINKPKSPFNYVLVDGDNITIPRMNNLVNIKGGIITESMEDSLVGINVPYHNTKRARFYINRYTNGFSKQAWKRKTYVIGPSGKIYQTKNMVFWRIYPKVETGSKIIIPFKEKTEREKKKSEPVDWNKAIERITVQTTALFTLWIIAFNVLQK